jgi:hypothetical protein
LGKPLKENLVQNNENIHAYSCTNRLGKDENPVGRNSNHVHCLADYCVRTKENPNCVA